MKTLYPDISPFNSDYLIQGSHKIYFEELGNPNGKPVVFLHGGPGGGGDKNVRRFFNPELYRIINFDNVSFQKKFCDFGRRNLSKD